MASFSLVALLVGFALSFWLSVFPFILALAGAIAVGLMAAAMRHVSVGQEALWSLILSVCAQVGFVLGLAARAALRGNRGPID